MSDSGMGISDSRLPSFDLSGRTALITGATSGIGRGITRAFAEAGADLVLVSDQDLGPMIAEVEAMGVTATPRHLDLAVRDGRACAASEIADEHDIDILVNNAGRIERGPAEHVTDEAWYDVVELNLHATFDLCRAVGRRMLDRGGGKLINIASLLSFQGGMNAASYAASKHALVGLTRALANEWAGRNVNVNAIAPGYVHTALSAALHDDPAQRAAITSRIPTGRWATPQDVAGPAVFLAAPASDYVNGHVLLVDGGWMSR